MIERLIQTAYEEGGECIVMGLSEPVAKMFNSLNVLKSVPSERFVDNLDEARVVAKDILDAKEQ